MSVTRLKMVGRYWREKAAERPKKPGNGTVAGGWELPVESLTEKPARAERKGQPKWVTMMAVDLRCFMRCRGRKPPERKLPRCGGGDFEKRP